MALTVKRATLWSIEAPNTPGTLAATLSPLAEQEVDLDLVMGYSHPDKTSATIEVYPVESSRARRAARQSGFSRSAFPCVTVTGDNWAGLGRGIAAALADVGINVNFFLAQVIDKKYTGMFSFEAESEADLAVKIIRDALRKMSEPARKGAVLRDRSTAQRRVSAAPRNKTARPKTAGRTKSAARRRTR